MDARTLRAWRSHRQGLDGSLDGATPETVLTRAGWSRSVGGVGPYLTLFARAGTSRGEADAAVSTLAIHELPSARGCTYVVPASDFALALTLAQATAGRERKTAEQFGVTDNEMARLADAILGSLPKAGATPEELRSAVGHAARNLGPEAARKGLTTTIPIALGEMQAQGVIRRVATNGRLDQQRYKYVRWEPSPLAGSLLSHDEAITELARRYFSWVGPATLAEFQWFAGVSGRLAKAAVAPLDLVSLDDAGLLLHRGDVDAFSSFRAPAGADYRLASSLDSLVAHRREIRSFLDEADAERPVFSSREKTVAGGLTDLPSHAILDRGRLVGMWEFDTEAGKIVWATFGKAEESLAAAIARTEAFVRADLGDARTFSLDSPKARGPRLDVLRMGFGDV